VAANWWAAPFDLEGALTRAAQFFVTGLHHPTARHCGGPPGGEDDEDLTSVAWAL
jgi:hypothetical protein